MTTEAFQEIIWQQGRMHYRDMPWRQNTDPYYVLVSELMLQQTQVERVIPKFEQFLQRFPTVADLAQAPLADVLTAWSGLGYNRRAQFLHRAAKKVMTEFDGVIPSTIAGLMSLPGVGSNTAGALLAYSFNQPAPFIETNVRTVYFHHFFADQAVVSDKELRTLVEETVDQENPRQWYWALMDYGSFLKKQGAARLDKSAHYKKQPPLKGSLREVRGLILKILKDDELTDRQLRQRLPQDERFEPALDGLLKDGLISRSDERLHFTR